MVRKKYKEHLGTKELNPDIKDKLKQVIDKYLEELAQSQVEITVLTDIKTEDGNKENNSIKDINVNCQNIVDSKSTTNITIKSEPTDVKFSDSRAIMSPPKKRIPRTVDKKEAPKRNMKFEDVMSAVQDFDAMSGLDEPSDASSDFDMLQKLSGKSNEEVSESAYEAESETDQDKTLTSKPKYFTPRRTHFEYKLSDSLNDSLGEITPVKRGIISDNELEDSPVLAKKSAKRKNLMSESGSESDNNALMIDLPTISSKHGHNSNTTSVNSAQKSVAKTDSSQNDEHDVSSLSDNEPLSKRLKGDDSITESDDTFLPGPKIGKKKGKSPAKKLLLKIKRVHNNSSDDNDYNYEISESNDEERTRKNQKSTVPSTDSDVMLVSHEAVVHQLLSNTDTDSNVSGPVKRQRKNITPAVVIDSDDDTSSTAIEPLPVSIGRKVKNKKPPNKKVGLWYGYDPFLDYSDDFDSNSELHPIAVERVSHVVESGKPARSKTAVKNPATPDDKELKFLRQICRSLGIVLRNTKELLGCTTSAEKVTRIRELLENAGMEGEPTMKKVQVLKLQKEVNELNEQNEKLNDEPTRGRPKRLAQTKLAERKKSPYVQDSSMFDGLEEIFDDEGSD
ncbi:hypothetical protein LOTGIDRAFT_168529 [Lottia gigantea]|uniref:Histone chaperone domain-containing protein n=1 Tax=Lottia gigantea TaxID=225164 RepID=V4B7Q3_LOTGI|nr:hypothetical protein LOTGIDRAFT_168529 [Lottia gigantea]ESO84664.1 hypothetical protein LOTGIDRAFT_168529 [Lottia gigantea]